MPYDAVMQHHRRAAKAINFGLMYGMSAFGLAKQLGVDRAEAAAYIHHYFDRYPGVRDYMTWVHEEAKAKGYVETLLHRRVYLPGIDASNRVVQQAAERAAINGPLQGSSADLIKLAMLVMAKALQMECPQAKMLLQVHDELVFEVPAGQEKALIALAQSVMSGVIKLEVPLVVDAASGLHWQAAH